MKKLVGTFLFLSLALVSLCFDSDAQTRVTKSPPAKSQPVADTRDTLEMVFVLDTTGSMGGLLEGAKQRIWELSTK